MSGRVGAMKANRIRNDTAINMALARMTQVSTLLSTFLSSRNRETLAVAE